MQQSNWRLRMTAIRIWPSDHLECKIFQTTEVTDPVILYIFLGLKETKTKTLSAHVQAVPSTEFGTDKSYPGDKGWHKEL
jgi:hypothetical protein